MYGTKSSAGEMDSQEEEKSDDEVDLGKMMKQMAREMAKMNKKIDGIKMNIRATVNEAVEPISARMDRLENKQLLDLDELKNGIDKKIADAVNKVVEKKENPSHHHPCPPMLGQQLPGLVRYLLSTKLTRNTRRTLTGTGKHVSAKDSFPLKLSLIHI